MSTVYYLYAEDEYNQENLRQKCVEAFRDRLETLLPELIPDEIRGKIDEDDFDAVVRQAAQTLRDALPSTDGERLCFTNANGMHWQFDNIGNIDAFVGKPLLIVDEYGRQYTVSQFKAFLMEQQPVISEKYINRWLNMLESLARADNIPR